MTKQIAFIGLGAMGCWMSANLLKAGFPLTVYDLNVEAMNDAVNAGAAAAKSPAEAACGAEVIIMMLPSSPHVEEVMLAENGVLQGAAKGATVINMSSIAPTVEKLVAAKAEAAGLHYLDAPVSGGIGGAQNATLAIMVGGDEQVFTQHLDIFKALGKKVAHVGPIASGQTIKMINQILCGVQMLVIAEAFTIGVKAGADPEKAYEIIKESAGTSFMLENRMPEFILKGDFDRTGFMLDLQKKDLGIAVETAQAIKVPSFFTSLAHNLYTIASETGKGRQEMCSVVTVLEDMANVKIRSKDCDK